MDVHSPKNGINRYWSIPIYTNNDCQGSTYYIGHSHSPKTCRDWSCLYLFRIPSHYLWLSLCLCWAKKERSTVHCQTPIGKVSLAKEYLRSPTVEGFPSMPLRYSTCNMSRDLTFIGWHETGQSGCHCAFVRLWPWQGMLKLMQQWLWPPTTQGCRCTTHFDTPCTLEASTLRTASCSSAQSNQRILHIKNGQPAIIWTVTDWLMTKTKTSLPLEISSKSCKTAIVLRKPKMQRTLEIEEFTTTKTAI